MTERIAAAALLLGDTIFFLPPPARHIDVARHIWGERGCYFYLTQEVQGFVTDTGLFVDREEGHKIAKAAGQLIPRKGGYRDGEINDRDGSHLFSEDLW